MGYHQIIHFKRIVHYKPTILGYPHLWNPHLSFQENSQERVDLSAVEFQHITWQPSVCIASKLHGQTKADEIDGMGQKFPNPMLTDR